MIKRHISEIAQIVNGKLFLPNGFSDFEIEQVITDSRTYNGESTSLFIALKGLRTDGHHFVHDMIEKGLKACIVSDPAVIYSSAVFILVNNTTTALQQLAARHRSRFEYPVVGITGSNGKTIIKEWLYEILNTEYQVVRNPKSYNSQIGVPLSVILMDNHFTLGIFEAGISKPHEMGNLAAVIQPQTGILTNIGDAHQENFSTKKQKTEEKLQLFTHSKYLVYCVDDTDTAVTVRQFCREHEIKEISWTTENKIALIRFTKQNNGKNTSIAAAIQEKTFRFSIPFSDASSIENACHCFACAWSLSDQPPKFLSRFENLTSVTMRLEIKQGINNCLLINDYYNSDLASFSIALSVLGQQAKTGHLKKIVILSDIQQTGIPQTELYHQVNQLLEKWEIDELIGIGPAIFAHSRAFTMKKKFYFSTDIFEKNLSNHPFKNSILLIKGARIFTFEKISAVLQQKAHQTVLEIDMNALINNLNIFRNLLEPTTKIMVMVKAFSYGSGDVEIAKLLQYQHADYLAVAVTDEGVELRQAGIQTPIIVMNPEEKSFQHIMDYRLEPNIYSIELLKSFEQAVTHQAQQHYPVHLKLDTGMNRLGFKTVEQVESLLTYLKKTDRIKILSVFSHLAASDDPAFDAFTQEQINRFERLSGRILAALKYPVYRHILNSAGIERFPEKQMEMVRLGIGLYGISTTGLPLQNISTFKSTISQIKSVIKGETVGYNRKGKITRDAKIAIVPVGYADGLDRKLGNGNGQAFINGNRAAIAGNICMDMVMLDVTGLQVQPGDEVEFFGTHVPLTEIAHKAGTIPYEILTGISQRVKRIYLHE